MFGSRVRPPQPSTTSSFSNGGIDELGQDPNQDPVDPQMAGDIPGDPSADPSSAPVGPSILTGMRDNPITPPWMLDPSMDPANMDPTALHGTFMGLLGNTPGRDMPSLGDLELIGNGESGVAAGDVGDTLSEYSASTITGGDQEDPEGEDPSGGQDDLSLMSAMLPNKFMPKTPIGGMGGPSGPGGMPGGGGY